MPEQVNMVQAITDALRLEMRRNERVVILGNSGGGSLMAAYQSQAVEPNVGPVTGMRPLPDIENLPPGDLYVALAAHSGRPEIRSTCRRIYSRCCPARLQAAAA